MSWVKIDLIFIDVLTLKGKRDEWEEGRAQGIGGTSQTCNVKRKGTKSVLVPELCQII